MTERPIIFSGPMIRAILDSTKTQTRRVIEPQPEILTIADMSGPIFKLKYLPGDRLWVKETLWRNGGYVATEPCNFPNEGKIPSIYMPRWTSRITLEVTDVRVEQVQDISTEDAIAEGCQQTEEAINTYTKNVHPPVANFSRLWDSINGKRPGCSWAANPWVWVVSFQKLN